MSSRSAPNQANATNEATGWLCCNFVVVVVLDGALIICLGMLFLALYYFFLPLFCQISSHFRGMLTYC
jgi:hypothetical protein